MGNANGREEGADGGTDDDHDHPSEGGRSNGELSARGGYAHRAGRVASSESMANSSPPGSPRRSVTPILFASQEFIENIAGPNRKRNEELVPVAPLRRGDGPSFFPQTWHSETREPEDCPPDKGIPTMITWNYGGNNVAVEGSWDNWTSRRTMQRSGKDFSILLVLPAGIYRYKLIVDGEWRYIPELPFIADDRGHICNLLDVNDYVPENLESVAEFEVPPSPESSYSQVFPAEEDFAKDPVLVPSQLHLTVLGMENSNEASSSSSSSSKPQHVVLNHLFIEKGWPSQSVVAMGLTHRFQSKYVTVVLYKPLKK
ncbi:SNF1-related protein kinase regulatory subunit beta-1 [Morus notabilis]|uniref:SNF1-related protein kinase regulatory subunit beta-1 n=1 Tax=Morus notabilis TaxID=981085 RepID=W9R2H8_9ROSA|nr:SNF1-related protein kinase regulatory subunit beta-1 [Morus notabilis]